MSTSIKKVYPSSEYSSVIDTCGGLTTATGETGVDVSDTFPAAVGVDVAENPFLIQTTTVKVE